MRVGGFALEKRRIAVIFLFAISVAAAAFVFTYVHQVQSQSTFRVTVSRLTMDPAGFDWRVHIEQLSYEELENGQVLIDEGTPHNLGGPFPSSANPKTIDGRVQSEFYVSWQPLNITIVWDGGREMFLFNKYPFAALETPQEDDYNHEKLAILTVSFDNSSIVLSMTVSGISGHECHHNQHCDN